MKWRNYKERKNHLKRQREFRKKIVRLREFKREIDFKMEENRRKI